MHDAGFTAEPHLSSSCRGFDHAHFWSGPLTTRKWVCDEAVESEPCSIQTRLSNSIKAARMSYARDQSNGTPSYMNGVNRLQRFDFDTTPDTSADERSQSRGARRGGYGAFAGQSADQVQAPSRMERHSAQRRSQDQDANSTSRSQSRPGVRYGTAGNQVEGECRHGRRSPSPI